jgi:hypothetical protein
MPHAEATAKRKLRKRNRHKRPTNSTAVDRPRGGGGAGRSCQPRRLLHWNILDGGGSRLTGICNFVRDGQYDVLTLNELNGFDEDYVRAGIGEDTDIEWRLLKHGLELRNVKHACLLYHLHHRQVYLESEVAVNIGLMKAKMAQGNIRCLNGLEKPRAVEGIAV